MFNVKHTKPLLSRPGSKVRFNSNELLVHMPCELVYPFLPHMGRARDPYCGKMTTVIAFLPTGRQCIRNKKTYDVLKAAIQLLFAFLPSITQPKRHLNRTVLWSFRKQSSQVTLRQKCYPTYPPQKNADGVQDGRRRMLWAGRGNGGNWKHQRSSWTCLGIKWRSKQGFLETSIRATKLCRFYSAYIRICV